MAMHSEISLDFNFMLADQLDSEQGVSLNEIESLFPTARKIQEGLIDLERLGQLPFQELPYNEDMATKIKTEGERVFRSFDDIVVLGIGGSGLGPACLYDCLKPPLERLRPRMKRGAPRLFVIDNIDPAVWRSVADVIHIEKTLFIVISKSGKTVETLAAFAYFRDLLIRKVGQKKYRDNIAIITDPHEGPLRKLADEEKLLSFDIPPGVGGRYSVLSPVGLFPAACVALEVDEILAGARLMHERAKNKDFWVNPPYIAAILHFLMATQKKKSMRVLMPYCEALDSYTEWFCQLWAESLGKNADLSGKAITSGLTPIRAMGATDQHSQLQLYLDGPRDKVISFYTVADGLSDKIPPSYEGLTEFTDIQGKGVSELLNMEYQATERALRNAAVPSLTFQLPHLNPKTLGQLFLHAELETVVTGEIYNINPFDQPAVESIKQYIKGLLGVSGFEKQRQEIDSSAKNERYVI